MTITEELWPKDWEVFTLDQVCDIQIGRTPPVAQDKYWNGTHTWVSIRDMNEYVVTDSKRRITDAAIHDKKVILVPKGSLLMSFKLTIGKMAFAGEDLYTNEAIAALKIKPDFVDKIRYDYLYWVLQVIPLEKDVDFAVKGKTLNKEKIKKIEFPAPSINIQRSLVARIESFLAELREIRELHTSIDRDMAQLMKGVLADVYDNLAESYSLTRTANVCTSITDGAHATPTYTDEGIPFLFVGNIVRRQLDFSVTKFVPKEYYESITNTRKPKVGDILYSVVGSYGVPVLVDINKPFAFQRHIAILKPNHDKIDSGFFRWMLDTPQVFRQADKAVTGAAQKTLALTHLRRLQFPCPVEKDTQRQVAAYLDSIYSELLEMRSIQSADTVLLDQVEQSILEQAFRGDL
jgi:type I restriction enzyme S subunit